MLLGQKVPGPRIPPASLLALSRRRYPQLDAFIPRVLGSSGSRALECNPDQRLLRIHHHSWESTTWISAKTPVDSTSAASLLGVGIAGTLGSVVLEWRLPAWRTGDRRLEGASQGVEGVQVAVEVVSEELPGREFSVTGLPSIAVVENDP